MISVLPATQREAAFQPSNSSKFSWLAGGTYFVVVVVDNHNSPHPTSIDFVGRYLQISKHSCFSADIKTQFSHSLNVDFQWEQLKHIILCK